jgi:hypothetical protein
MAKASNRKHESGPVRRRFGSDQDVALLTGLSRRTLQQDRLRGTDRFPFYRSGGRILYDLEEVEAAIRANRVTSNRERF